MILVIGRFNIKFYEMEREIKLSYININLVFVWILEKILVVMYYINSLRVVRCLNLFLILNFFFKKLNIVFRMYIFDFEECICREYF